MRHQCIVLVELKLVSLVSVALGRFSPRFRPCCFGAQRNTCGKASAQICMYVSMHVACRSAGLYVCVYACMHTCRDVSMYVDSSYVLGKHACSYVVCRCTCMYVCMHACTYVQMQHNAMQCGAALLHAAQCNRLECT